MTRGRGRHVRPKASRFPALLAKARSPAAGAVVAQVWQAVASFLLQIVAARTLGAGGLAVVSLSYGVIILATAVSSGVIGDSLTVLDRHDPAIRGALEAFALMVVVGLALVSAVGLTLFGVLTPWGGLIFCAAVAAFMVEDLVRRLHMTVMGFWKLILVDSTAVVGTAVVIVIGFLRSGMTIEILLLAILVGQTAGAVSGWLLLPSRERRPARLRIGGIGRVAGFGVWRGIQVSIPPAVQTASRVVITVSAGTVALGHVEAGRIFMAPAMLTVQGLGSYLIATFARKSNEPLERSTALATKASLLLVAGALGLGGLAVLLVPWGGQMITGTSFSLNRIIVMGWAVYAAAAASLQPFASLAVVRGRQRLVLQVRLIDSVLALVALWVVLAPLRTGVESAPFVLAAGLVLGGILVRGLVLRPLRNAASAA